MGYITVQLGGSFSGAKDVDGHPHRFEAIANGHADAVAQAIEYLSAKVLPAATALDHKLHNDGATPDEGWVREPPT